MRSSCDGRASFRQAASEHLKRETVGTDLIAMKAFLQLAVATVVLAGAAHGADLAILRNGNSIRHERRQVIGAITRLYLNAGDSGFIEIPTDQIERFEKDTSLPPLTVSSAPAKSQLTPMPSPQSSIAVPRLTREGLNQVVAEIGRASCRERVESWGVDGSWNT